MREFFWKKRALTAHASHDHMAAKLCEISFSLVRYFRLLCSRIAENSEFFLPF